MNFTELFIRRPILATVLNLFLLIAGWQGIKALVVRQYPYTSNAVVTVSVAYPGANADLVRGFVTTPLEREISSADGIDFVESVSRQNSATITARSGSSQADYTCRYFCRLDVRSQNDLWTNEQLRRGQVLSEHLRRETPGWRWRWHSMRQALQPLNHEGG